MYSDFTSISTDLSKGSGYTVTVTPTWTGTTYSEGYSVWIDYNQDGDFTDSGEQVWTNAATQNSPVSGSFTVPASATNGATRMRVSMKYNGIPTSCEAFSYGEVEDYTVNIITGTPDTTPPVITLTGASTINLEVGDTYTELGATATDNEDGDISSSIAITGTVNTNAAGTYTRFYNVSDSAGNAATQVTRTVIVTQPTTGSCTGGISAFPYSESFENTLGAWTQSTSDDFNWTVDANGTPSSNTGPSSASAGTYYVYMESSSPNYSTKRAILNSPCFDLSAESQATFSFDYHMYGASSMGSLALQASDNNGATWTNVWSQSGNQGNSWQTATVDLSAYVGGTVQLRFNGVTGTTWQGDMAVDAINLSTSGGGNTGCSNATLSITFDNYPEETAWTLTNNSGQTVASGGTYGSQADGSTLNIPVGCLDDGCYNFTITDTYGDGICCSYGNGSYTLTNTDTGAILASGGSFTSSETTNFCLTNNVKTFTSTVTNTNNFDKQFKLYPNPVKQTLNVDLVGFEAQSFEIKNMLGQTVLKGTYKSSIDVSKFNSGIYILQLNIGEKTKIKRFIKE
ncbi:MAG TPA: DUF5011 domain-containing protein [Flavobacteriaceae bacterium]|nr:DUF5011 domain-containing protein [Flavobacteriaceae bacterium]